MVLTHRLLTKRFPRGKSAYPDTSIDQDYPRENLTTAELQVSVQRDSVCLHHLSCPLSHNSSSVVGAFRHLVSRPITNDHSTPITAAAAIIIISFCMAFKSCISPEQYFVAVHDMSILFISLPVCEPLSVCLAWVYPTSHVSPYLTDSTTSHQFSEVAPIHIYWYTLF